MASWFPSELQSYGPSEVSVWVSLSCSSVKSDLCQISVLFIISQCPPKVWLAYKIQKSLPQMANDRQGLINLLTIFPYIKCWQNYDR